MPSSPCADVVGRFFFFQAVLADFYVFAFRFLCELGAPFLPASPL